MWLKNLVFFVVAAEVPRRAGMAEHMEKTASEYNRRSLRVEAESLWRARTAEYQ